MLFQPKTLKIGNDYTGCVEGGLTLDAPGKIIKIIEIKSRDRIALPQEARERLNVKEGEYVAILEDDPGIRVVKVKLDLKENET